MIYFLLILFFGSLLSIVFMIGKKLTLINEGKYEVVEEASFEIPYLKEAGHLTAQNLKKYEHIALVNIIWVYVQATSFLKRTYRQAETKVQAKFHKNKMRLSGTIAEQEEASKFLKIISDYKHRIKEIKHRIKEEEKEN